MAKQASNSAYQDVAVARRAIGLVVGLSGGAHNVAYALLEHYNRATGQCDPSVARLATMLGLGTASVKRATRELCVEYALFEKSSHGGKSHRAKYVPNWKKLRAIADDWDARMATGAAPGSVTGDVTSDVTGDASGDLFEASKVSEVIPSRDQERSLEGINIDPRTHMNKPKGSNPSVSDGECGRVEASGEPISDGETDRLKQASAEPLAEVSQGLLRGQAGQGRGQPPQVVPSGKQRVAEQAAMRRWHGAMLRRGQDAYARFLEWVTDEISDSATAAEMRRHGDGLRLIIDRMNDDGVVTSDV